MRRPALAVAVALAAACGSQANGVTGRPVVQDTAGGSCAAAVRVLEGPSPFERALARWAEAAPSTAEDAASRAALDAACEAARDDARGTERAACALLGYIRAAGDGVPRDARGALADLERGSGCSFDFGAHDATIGVAQGIATRFAACCGGRGCASGCQAACTRAADAVEAAVVPPLERACRNDRPAACMMLSFLVAWADGSSGEYVQELGPVGRPGDIAEVRRLAGRACARGLGPACERAAFLLEGELDARDRIELMRRACNLDWGAACAYLADAEERARRHASALALWERACALGMDRVCAELPDARDR